MATIVAEPFDLDFDPQTGPGPLDGTVRRTVLDRGAWVDTRPGWLHGADALFQRLVEGCPWRAERRQMYDRVVDVPRLLCFYDEDAALPDPALDALSVPDEVCAHFKDLGDYDYRPAREVASADEKSPTPVFLLAYVAYNTGNERRAAAYLDLAEKRSDGKDPTYKQ